ncbi:twin BRCT domain-containing protein isoform 4 [Cladophialophora immunda]|nr:twin BRCT domain-containing protein isoform 1 [Cladophialophora immunda]OQU94299.1 twin BRCT domain-containing protein isoform 2 [Cladophialophora immunda]OQU94300.1 twin BRCT domain-containing protein isoform 4 [Cladophialophora immunda]
MARMEPRGSAEQPLQGVMMCFTSIGPEDRSRYADIAMQMGAEHKLDLTSDTTHLIVGSTDTLKYQYVAREREDIKVLRPEWIEAVRDHWIKDLPLDLDALTLQYRVPTLAGLKICITGFDDLAFRAQLQKNVKENGGEYTGDLTKDVTHLIAAKPEGKKYEYGMQWQKKVVSLKWYKDTLERGMQLDERLYHPTVPVPEQGLGAWNRKARPSPQLGKRTREDNMGPEPSRKLRKTASAKFGSQTQDMWSDIVGGAGFEPKRAERPELKPSISMPALRDVARPSIATSNHRAELTNGAPDPITKSGSLRFLTGRRFVVKYFEEKKRKHLQNVLVEYGATILSEGDDPGENKPDSILIIQPHDISKNGSASTGLVGDGFQAVSEFWLEKCMLAKAFIDPGSYPLGQILTGPLACLKDLTINATGFDGLEAVHISKIATLLGGNYSQMFTEGVSILVCKAGNAKKDKLDLAQHLGIPVVNEEWLWTSIKNQTRASVESYLLRQARPRIANSERPADKRSVLKDYVEVSTIPLPRNAGDHRANHPSKPVGNGTHDGVAPEIPVEKSHPDPNVQQEPAEEIHGQAKEGPFASSSASGASGRSENKERSYDNGNCPLRVLSPNGRNTRLVNNRPLIQTLDSTLPMDDSTSKENAPAPIKTGARAEVQSKTTDIEAINGAIRDILNEHSRKKSAGTNQTDPLKKKNRLFGRALSNLSNSSTASNVRCSRASSVDSINTDGIGSEIVTMQSVETQSGESTSTAEKGTFNFTGRAKRALAALKSAPLEMDDPDMPRNVGFPTEQDAAPPMTQLGYEDPEEAILLREKLAASRKKGSGKDRANEEDEEAPPARRLKSANRKIRDDDLLASVNAGWGAGKRTRHKQRSPPGQGIKDF